MHLEIQQPVLLGILGGMGPLATVDFLKKITQLTPAHCDQEHVPWVVISQPGIPDRSTAIRTHSDAPSPYLTKGVAWLAEQGVQLIVVPCNTSHFWFDAMQKASRVPILHIADATVEALQSSQEPTGAIAVLATRVTVQAGIYSQRLMRNGFEIAFIDENEQLMVDKIIHSVKSGALENARSLMHALQMELIARGVRTMILGCTELPLAYEPTYEQASNIRAIDTSEALAAASLRRLGFL